MRIVTKPSVLQGEKPRLQQEGGRGSSRGSSSSTPGTEGSSHPLEVQEQLEQPGNAESESSSTGTSCIPQQTLIVPLGPPLSSV